MGKVLKTYIVKTNDPTYCGIGAGGIQFAYGQAEVQEGWVLEWYKERGYKLELKKDKEELKKDDKDDKK